MCTLQMSLNIDVEPGLPESHTEKVFANLQKLSRTYAFVER